MRPFSKLKWQSILTLGIILAIYPMAAQAVAPEAKPALEIPFPRHDAGTHWEGEVVSHTYEVRNSGNGELKILSVKPG